MLALPALTHSTPGWGRSPGGGNGSLPGESHDQRSLVDYSPRGRKESDTTEATKQAPQFGVQSLTDGHRPFGAVMSETAQKGEEQVFV